MEKRKTRAFLCFSIRHAFSSSKVVLKGDLVILPFRINCSSGISNPHQMNLKKTTNSVQFKQFHNLNQTNCIFT